MQNKVVTGNGTDITDSAALLKRANKKVITNALVFALVYVVNEKGDFQQTKKYWGASHCQTDLTSYEKKIYGDYCKLRGCTVCCGIRKADMLFKYYPIVIKWEEPHLLTLTLKSVTAGKLSHRVTQMIKAFERIKDRCNKRHIRGKGMKIMGIKSLESNFNSIKKWYNPHFHIIVPNRQIALYIEQEWRKEWNKNGEFRSSEKGQDIRKIENVEGLIEVIKYGAKILCDPDPTKKRKRIKGDLSGLNIYASALHCIYMAMDGHRLFGRFGIKLLKPETKKGSLKIVSDYGSWKYNTKELDWINVKTKKHLTNYEIDAQLEYLIKTCIVKEIC